MSDVAQDQFKEIDKLLFFACRLRKLGVLVSVGGDSVAERQRLAAAIVDHDLGLAHTTYGAAGHATFAKLFERAFSQSLAQSTGDQP